MLAPSIDTLKFDSHWVAKHLNIFVWKVWISKMLSHWNVFPLQQCDSCVCSISFTEHLPILVMIWYSWSISESPGNSGSPVSISANRQPTAHTSTAL